MAGRPLRRLRNSLRLNPLVGWEDTSGLNAATALEPYVPLVKQGSEDTYKKVYTRVDLPIAVAIRPPGWNGRKNRAQLLQNQEQDLALAERLGAVLLVTTVSARTKGERWYSADNQRRGSSDRLSPFTPFVLLHRLGDGLNGESVLSPWRSLHPHLAEIAEDLSALRRLERSAVGVDDEVETAILSRGVDTAAGRVGVLGTDVLSDIFAKWLLTGRIAYDPVHPPSDTKQEQRYRDFLAAFLPRLMHAWRDYLANNLPMVVYV